MALSSLSHKRSSRHHAACFGSIGAHSGPVRGAARPAGSEKNHSMYGPFFTQYDHVLPCSLVCMNVTPQLMARVWLECSLGECEE